MGVFETVFTCSECFDGVKCFDFNPCILLSNEEGNFEDGKCILLNGMQI